MSLNKEKLISRIKQDIENAEITIEHVLKSKNYYVAGELKFVAEYLRIIVWDIEHGKYDLK